VATVPRDVVSPHRHHHQLPCLEQHSNPRPQCVSGQDTHLKSDGHCIGPLMFHLLTIIWSW
jgi:hypothetical protein